MKRNFYYTAIICIVLLLYGCTDETKYDQSIWSPSQTEQYLHLSNNNLTYNASTDLTKTLQVQCVNVPWEFKDIPSWLSLNPISGNADSDVVGTATINTSGSDIRTSVFSFVSQISDYPYSQNIAVTQQSATPFITPETQNLSVSASGTVCDFRIDSNIDWDVATTTSWVQVTKSDDRKYIHIIVDENTSGVERSARVDLTGKKSESFSIIQSAPKVTYTGSSILDFANNGGTKTISFTSEVSWSVLSSVEWIQFDKRSGTKGESTLIISVPPTNSENVREGYVYVNIGSNCFVTIKINQSANVLNVSSDKYNVSAKGETVKINVESNIEWTCSSSSWLDVSASNTNGNGAVTVKVPANTSATSRSGTVYVKGRTLPSIERKIDITQNAAGVTLDITSLTYSNVSASKNVTVTADAPWTAISSSSWIDVIPNSGTEGTSTIAVNVSPNSTTSKRQGIVDIKIASQTVAGISVLQEGLSLTASPASLTFSSNADSKTINVTSNTEWQVTSKPEWVDLSGKSGNGNASIGVSVQDNPNTTSRSGIITLGYPGTDLKASVSVSQAGCSFDDVIKSLYFTTKAETKTTEIKTTGSWTATTANEWIHVSPSSGSGDSTLEISVDENNGDNDREGFVSITVGQTTKTITVTQQGRYFSVVVDESISVLSVGGTHKVSIMSSEHWIATTQNSWLSLSDTEGDGNLDLIISVGDNASIKPRIGETVITPAISQAVRISTPQAGRYLNVDTEKLSFFAKGGVSDVVTISTDATYMIFSSVTWATVNKTGNKFTVTATENPGTVKREGLITIAMTGLENNEQYSVNIPMVQLPGEYTIGIDTFDSDEDWNIGGETNGIISISGFDADDDWNLK